MRILGVIPARGGSKGVKNKNIKPISGKPLIGYTIDAANASKLDKCIVSTDSNEIALLAQELGGLVPFIRPENLASDSAKAIPVIAHALEYFESIGEVFDAVMMLQPTTPFRLADDIDQAINTLEETNADSVISVIDVEGHHPARMKYLSKDGKLIDPDFCEAYENQPRQELETMYLRNGAIYLSKVEMIKAGTFKGNDCRAQVMGAERSVNIDTEMDFAYAQWIHSTFIK